MKLIYDKLLSSFAFNINPRPSTKAEGNALDVRPWGGGVGPTQMEWLRGELKMAEEAGERVLADKNHVEGTVLPQGTLRYMEPQLRAGVRVMTIK